jgi:DNA adenine methylase
VGFVGFGCSYSGKWFGGYARGNSNNGTPRNYCLESKKNILAQYDGLQGIQIYNKNYWELDIPENSIIYCDPPYENTTKYKDNFDHDKFWKWCEKKSLEDNSVFVSEYHAPSGWKSIWSKEVHNTLVKDTGSKIGIENLFIFT